MTTIHVWVLLLSFINGHGGNPIIIDNIATSAECQRIAAVLKGTDYGYTPKCFEVIKVR